MSHIFSTVAVKSPKWISPFANVTRPSQAPPTSFFLVLFDGILFQAFSTLSWPLRLTCEDEPNGDSKSHWWCTRNRTFIKLHKSQYSILNHYGNGRYSNLFKKHSYMTIQTCLLLLCNYTFKLYSEKTPCLGRNRVALPLKEFQVTTFFEGWSAPPVSPLPRMGCNSVLSKLTYSVGCQVIPFLQKYVLTPDVKKYSICWVMWRSMGFTIAHVPILQNSFLKISCCMFFCETCHDRFHPFSVPRWAKIWSWLSFSSMHKPPKRSGLA